MLYYSSRRQRTSKRSASVLFCWAACSRSQYHPSFAWHAASVQALLRAPRRDPAALLTTLPLAPLPLLLPEPRSNGPEMSFSLYLCNVFLCIQDSHTLSSYGMKDGDFVHAAISEEVLYSYLFCTSAFPPACRPTIFLCRVESPPIICLVLRGDACVRAAAPFMCVSRARAVAVCECCDVWCMCAVLCRPMFQS